MDWLKNRKTAEGKPGEKEGKKFKNIENLVVILPQIQFFPCC